MIVAGEEPVAYNSRVSTMSIAQLFFGTFYLYLPAMVANMAPVIAHNGKLLLWLDRPLDFGLQWKGKQLLGSHKTIRGFFVGILAGGCTALMQALIFSRTPYEQAANAFMFGAVLGFGALVGDAAKSFFKRRLHIASGTLWIPFDQIDFIFGATLTALLFVKVSLMVFIIAIIVGGFLSYIVSSIGFALHIKRSL